MTSTPLTVRLPPDVIRFLEDSQSAGKKKSAVVIEALRARMRQDEIEREVRIIREAGGSPYPDLEPASSEQVDDVWKGLDW